MEGRKGERFLPPGRLDGNPIQRIGEHHSGYSFDSNIIHPLPKKENVTQCLLVVYYYYLGAGLEW
jgi:hypothetical protein